MIPCTKAAHDTRTMFRYGITIFISAFLLFQVQPLFGRLILPWFGGSSATWTTCLLCFQALLLAGYSYAHFSVTRLTPRQQRNVHVGLLVLGLIFLPIIPSEAWKPTGLESPALRILGVLVFTVGVAVPDPVDHHAADAGVVRPGDAGCVAVPLLRALESGITSRPPQLSVRRRAKPDAASAGLPLVDALRRLRGPRKLVRLAGSGAVGCAGPAKRRRPFHRLSSLPLSSIARCGSCCRCAAR